MSKKIFFIVLTCCLLVVIFCVSFAGAPQVHCAPANVRAVLDRPDCAAAPLIVPPVVEPPLMDFVVPDSMVGTWYVNFDHLPTLTGLYTLQDFYAPVGVYFTAIYQGVTYDTVTSVYLGHLSGFSYDIDGSSDSIDCDSSFSFVIESNSYHFYDSDDVEVSSGTVFSSFPDGFLTRVNVPIFGVEITVDIVDILVSGIVGVGESLGSSFSTLAESIFINADGTGLSMFATLVVCFSGVSLCLSLTRWVLNFCSSLGKRNR